MNGRHAVYVSIWPEDDARISRAESGRVLEKRLEDCLKVEDQAAGCAMSLALLFRSLCCRRLTLASGAFALERVSAAPCSQPPAAPSSAPASGYLRLPEGSDASEGKRSGGEEQGGVWSFAATAYLIFNLI